MLSSSLEVFLPTTTCMDIGEFLTQCMEKFTNNIIAMTIGSRRLLRNAIYVPPCCSPYDWLVEGLVVGRWPI